MIDMIVHKYDVTEYIDDDLFRKNHTVNHMWTDILNRYGYVQEDRTQKIQNWTFFSSDFFNPIYGFGGFKVKKILTPSIIIVLHGKIQKKERRIILGILSRFFAEDVWETL